MSCQLDISVDSAVVLWGELYLSNGMDERNQRLFALVDAAAGHYDPLNLTVEQKEARIVLETAVCSDREYALDLIHNMPNSKAEFYTKETPVSIVEEPFTITNPETGQVLTLSGDAQQKLLDHMEERDHILRDDLLQIFNGEMNDDPGAAYAILGVCALSWFSETI